MKGSAGKTRFFFYMGGLGRLLPDGAAFFISLLMIAIVCLMTRHCFPFMPCAKFRTDKRNS
jgi:hypothetical protein